jgi:hypothetical protein
LTFGHIGVGGMGGHHLRDIVGFVQRGQANIAAVCDIDDRRLETPPAPPGRRPTCYRDYRYVLDRKDIDAVVIATPDHWHAVQTVHAAERGKHVYVEKPACCTIEEGKAMIAAANKARIAVQVGSQGRSQPEAYLAHRYLATATSAGDAGRLLPLPESVGRNGARPRSARRIGLGPVARPAPLAALQPRLLPRHVPLDDGIGRRPDPRPRRARDELCHVVDGTPTAPVRSRSKPRAKRRCGLWDSAVKINVKYTFKNPDWVLTWNQPGEPAPPEERTGRNRAERSRVRATAPSTTATRARFTHWGGDGGTWAERKAREWQPGAGAVDVYRSPGHMEDWFEGIKTGKKTIMNVEAGADVAILTVLGNLSFLLGRKLQMGPQPPRDRRRRTGPASDGPAATLSPTLSEPSPANQKDSSMEELTLELLIEKIQSSNDAERAARATTPARGRQGRGAAGQDRGDRRTWKSHGQPTGRCRTSSTTPGVPVRRARRKPSRPNCSNCWATTSLCSCGATCCG